MKRPLIGVTCNYDYRDTVGMTSGMGIVGQDWNFVAGDYVYILEKAGAIPVLIPVYKDCDEESIKEFLNKLDGVIISGGHDVGPEQYNTPTKGYCGTIIPQRDNHDIAVAKYFMNEIKKPILGICRGIQIMNVAAGGTLYQDLEIEGKFEHHFGDKYPRNYPWHDLKIEKGSILEEIYGKTEIRINSFHHQAVKDPGRRIVMIAGPSSSGKTTFSHRLSTQFAALGYNPHPISVDNYFRNREEYPLDENGQPDFEALGCVDIPQFNEDMNALLSGKTIELPRFNFKTGKREYKGEMLKLGKKDILVIEGIHCLNDAMSSELPKDSKFKIYISALTQLNVDEHNRIPTTDGRLIRRMVRDARTRGTSALETIERWPSVRRGEDKNIFPYQESADVMFNSALVYELAVLKLYAEPLLFNIPRDREEYDEAKRLLKFLDYFLAIDSDVIPKTSILREFIGGSCLNV